LPEDLDVFVVDLGRLDVLLAASDFYAAAASADYRLDGDPALGGARLATKGRSHDCVLLEPLLERLFSPALPAEGAEATAFLMDRPGSRPRAFVLRREFTMLAFPLREFRLLPGCLRARQSSLGLVALRFAGAGRIQYLVSLGAAAPPAATGGGA
jgi:hypothetical protein